ncbi:MAG: M1 family aminopeptidase [Candidatus Acidiferrales bacterium]
MSATERTDRFYQARSLRRAGSLLSDALSGTVGAMLRFLRFSPSLLLVLGCAEVLSLPHAARAMQSPQNSQAASATAATTSIPPAPVAQPIPTDPLALYQALSALRADGTRVYTVNDLNLRRDVINFTFSEGKLAFLQPLGGRVTGIVFAGRGHVIATPHERGERRSLAQFLGVPILDVSFSAAYIRFTDDTGAEIERLLKQNNAEPAADPVFAQRWDPEVAALGPSQSLRVMTDLLSTNPLPYFYTLLDGDSFGPFEVTVDQRRNEQVLIGQVRMNNGIPVYDVWAHFPAEDSPKISPETFAPLDYRVDSTIGEDLSLTGKTTLHLKTLRAGERVVPLELSRDLTISDIRGDDGQTLPYFQNEELSRRNVARRGNDSILVVLPSAHSAAQDFHLEVAYHGNVIADAGNGVDFVGERGTWYAHTEGTHFAQFDLTFHWPKHLTLVATGVESDAREDASAKFGRWRSDVPFANAGFNLSEYKTQAATGQPQVQVFANQQLENAILERLRVTAASERPPSAIFDESRPGQIVQQVPPPPMAPSPSAALKQVSGEVADSIRFLEKLNGDFPFNHLDVTQIPGSFGQGWPELVYLSTLAFLPPDTAEVAGLNAWARSAARDLMPCHETAHQWWGNVVGAASYRDVWIQEGMADYLSLLYAESKKPSEHILTKWLNHYRDDLVARIPGSDHSIEDVGPLVLGPRLASAKIPEAYDTLIYGKGAWVMHMLHEMLRDPESKDPDARYREFLRAVLSEYRFKPLSTEDFQRAAEQHMTPAMDLDGNHKMDWFFEQWVRGTGMPHYTVKFEAKARGHEFLVSGNLEQDGVEDVFTAPVPLYASSGGGKPQRLGVVVTTGPETHFRFVSRVRPSRIVIDPYLTLLCRKD